MSDDNDYVRSTVRSWVWSGFYNPDDVRDMLPDILEEDSDESDIEKFVEAEFERKRREAASWPAETDCDRLDQAFEELNARGVIALQNAGHTLSDGLEDIADALSEVDASGFFGYCFYHGQDLERVLSGDVLLLAFGDLNENDKRKLEVGRIVRDVFREAGFDVRWEEAPEKRIELVGVDWKRR